MNPIKEIFATRTIVLLMSILLFIAFVKSVISANDNSIQLVKHEGIIEKKFITENKSRDAGGDESVEKTLTIKMVNNPANYIVSSNVVWINVSIDVGDTVQVFTAKNAVAKGILAVTETGFKATDNPNEVFQLISNKDNAILVNFDLNQGNLKKTVWILLPFSLLCFGWYIYLLRGTRNPFIITSGQ